MASEQSLSTNWDNRLLQNPHAVADKRSRVQKMFSAIAPSYDLNNRLHSLWMDQLWRQAAVKQARLKAGDVVVDVACGTGDLTFAFARGLKKVQSSPLQAGQLIGIDFTYAMLPLARQKALATHGNKLARPYWINGDAQTLPLPDGSCDVLSIAFGIRNVQEPAVAIAEFYRVLRPGGRLIILEFSLPTNPVVRGTYNLYFRRIIPFTATLISGDKTGAYKYLPESVNTFISREKMSEMMQSAGFTDVIQKPLTLGVSVIYRGIKPAV